jgi:hypothetical protein
MNDRHIAMLFLAVLIMGLAISTFGQSGPAWYSEHAGGHDWYRDHALRHDWYKDLKTKSGWSCCSGDEERGDCRPAQARQRDDGHGKHSMPAIGTSSHPTRSCATG